MKKKSNLVFIAIIILAGLLSRFYVFYSFAPTDYPDSQSYIRYANEILEFKGIPEEAPHRTPGYPLLLVFADWLPGGIYKTIMPIQILLGIASLLLLYGIVNLITKNKILSLLLSLIAVFNFNVFCFEATILTETFSVFLVMTSSYLHLKFFSGKKNYILVLAIISDIFLMTTRPIFLALPFCFYLFHLLVWIFTKIYQKNKKTLGIVLLGFLVGLAVIGFMGYMFKKQTNRWGLTVVSDVNLMGKVIQYDMLNSEDEKYGKIATEIKQEIATSGNVNPHIYYPIYFNLRGGEVADFNRAMLQGNKAEFYFKSLKMMSSIDRANNFSNYTNRFLDSKFFKAIGQANVKFYRYIYEFFLLTVVFYIILIATRRIKFETATQIFLLIATIFYTFFLTIAYSYGDYARLRVPVDYLVYLAFFSILYILVLNLWKNKKIN